MLRRINILFLLLTIAVASTGCIKDDDTDNDLVGVGDQLPQFSVQMNDGSTISTNDLLGAPSLIVFFDTTCPDCQQAMPRVDSLYLEYGIGAGGKSSGQVHFVCISRAQGEEIVAAYWEESGFSMPYSAQEDRTVYNLFATMTVPRVYISDSQTIVRSIYTDSPLPEYEDLLQDITALL